MGLRSVQFNRDDLLRAIEKPVVCPALLASYAQTFCFFSDMAVISEYSARKQARAFLERWIFSNHSFASKSWATESWLPWIVGLRVSNWIAFFDFYAGTASDDFKKFVRISLDKQLRYLLRHWDESQVPTEQLWALKGIFMAYEMGLMPYVSRKKIASLIAKLPRIIERQTLRDGGHISRNGSMQWRIIRDLIDIRFVLQAISQQTTPAPVIGETLTFVTKHIEHMVPILRLFRHGNGELAQFSGTLSDMWTGICCNHSTGSIDHVLSVAVTDASRPPQRAAITGLERCASRNSVLLINTYPHAPPTDAVFFEPVQQLDSHQPIEDSSHISEPVTAEDEWVHHVADQCPGTEFLSFDWSVGRHHIIVKSDMFLLTHDHVWLQNFYDPALELKIKRHSDELEHLIDFSSNYRWDDVHFDWHRRLYTGKNASQLRGIDTVRVNKSCIMGIRFYLNPAIHLVKSGDIIKITYVDTDDSAGRPRHMQREELVFADMSHANTARFKESVTQEWFFQAAYKDSILQITGARTHPLITVIKEFEASIPATVQWELVKK